MPPELFATYLQLAADSRGVVRAHVDDLSGQLARIIADGVARGELTAADPATAGRAVFDATARFHNPTHAPEWSDPGIDAAYEGVRSLVPLGWVYRSLTGIADLLLPTSAAAPSSPRGPSRDPTRPAVMVLLRLCGYAESRAQGVFLQEAAEGTESGRRL